MIPCGREMKYKFIIVGGLETNCYLVYCEDTKACVIVDPGAESDKIFPVIAEEELRPIAVINTHGHVDHIGANRDMKDKFDIPLWIHAGDKEMLVRTQSLELSLFLGAKDSPPPDRYLVDGDEIKIGNGRLRVLHTPGHSPGGMCLYTDGMVFTGDSLFVGSVGRTDFPGSSWDVLEASIQKKLFTLPGDTIVYPGHNYGPTPSSTIQYEKRHNPFVRG